MDPNAIGAFLKAIGTFVNHLSAQVQVRWSAWDPGNGKHHVREVVGGLLVRQATLASELAINPYAWNAHSGPLFLRPMVEICITIAWILKSPDKRAKQFIDFGLGQENLLLEHAKEGLREDGEEPEKDPEIRAWEGWLNTQRYTFLTEVNVGSWGPTLRDMAEEVGLLNLHRQDYARWSSSTHSMWHHILRYNIRHCTNPLHGYHGVPDIINFPPNPEFLQYAAEYMDKVISIFDEATGTNVDGHSAVEVLDRELMKLPPSPQNEAHDEASAGPAEQAQA